MRLIALVLPLVFACAFTAAAEDFEVTTGWDFEDPRRGDRICGFAREPEPDGTPRAPFCSLRAAVQEANTLSGGRHTIRLPAGMHYLWLRGEGEDLAVSGDLDIRGDVVIIGQGPARSSCPVDSWKSERTNRGCAPTLGGVRRPSSGSAIASSTWSKAADLSLGGKQNCQGLKPVYDAASVSRRNP